jgi:hypothetical protein
MPRIFGNDGLTFSDVVFILRSHYFLDAIYLSGASFEDYVLSEQTFYMWTYACISRRFYGIVVAGIVSQDSLDPIAWQEMSLVRFKVSLIPFWILFRADFNFQLITYFIGVAARQNVLVLMI